MRRSLALAALLFGMAATLPSYGQGAKESPGAAATRARLKNKITVEFKNEPLKNILVEISGALNEQKKGSLSFQYDTGVSQNTRTAVTGKNKTVEEYLDEALKPLDLGYVIVSKPGDRYDGWLMLKKGNQRGDDVPEGGKKDSSKEEKKKESAKKEEMKKDAGMDERAAAAKLANAKTYLSLKKDDKAKEILEALVKDYPETKAAEEAKKLLEKK